MDLPETICPSTQTEYNETVTAAARVFTALASRSPLVPDHHSLIHNPRSALYHAPELGTLTIASALRPMSSQPLHSFSSDRAMEHSSSTSELPNATSPTTLHHDSPPLPRAVLAPASPPPPYTPRTYHGLCPSYFLNHQNHTRRLPRVARFQYDSADNGSDSESDDSNEESDGSLSGDDQCRSCGNEIITAPLMPPSSRTNQRQPTRPNVNIIAVPKRNLCCHGTLVPHPCSVAGPSSSREHQITPNILEVDATTRFDGRDNRVSREILEVSSLHRRQILASLISVLQPGSRNDQNHQTPAQEPFSARSGQQGFANRPVHIKLNCGLIISDKDSVGPTAAQGPSRILENRMGFQRPAVSSVNPRHPYVHQVDGIPAGYPRTQQRHNYQYPGLSGDYAARAAALRASMAQARAQDATSTAAAEIVEPRPVPSNETAAEATAVVDAHEASPACGTKRKAPSSATAQEEGAPEENQESSVQQPATNELGSSSSSRFRSGATRGERRPTKRSRASK